MILEQTQFITIDIFGDQKLGSSKNRNAAQEAKAREIFGKFINQEKLAAIVYCDGSVLERQNGNGGCGSIIIHEGNQIKRSQSESMGRLTDNVTCEVEGIKLGLQQALSFHEEFQPTSDKCFILK